MRAKRRPIRLQLQPMHRVMHRFARERITDKFRPEKAVAINADPTTRSHLVHALRVIESLKRLTDWKYPHRLRTRREQHPRRRRRHVRIAPAILLRQRKMKNPISIAAAEPVSGVIASPPLLRDTRRRLKRERIRVHAKIAPAYINLL